MLPLNFANPTPTAPALLCIIDASHDTLSFICTRAEIVTLTVLSTSLILVMLAVVVAGVWMHFAYQRDLRASRERLRGASHVIETPCGPIEYTESGDGAPLLVVHGAGGGFDQGMELGQSLASRGFRVIAMSRFGYLRTPLPQTLPLPPKRMPTRPSWMHCKFRARPLQVLQLERLPHCSLRLGILDGAWLSCCWFPSPTSRLKFLFPCRNSRPWRIRS